LLVMLHSPSNTKAKHHSTWSWRQVNRPWLRAILILSKCALMWQVMNTKDKRDPLLPKGLGSVVMGGHHMLT